MQRAGDTQLARHKAANDQWKLRAPSFPNAATIGASQAFWGEADALLFLLRSMHAKRHGQCDIQP